MSDETETGCRVELTRGAVVESRHRVHVAVVDAEGRLRAFAGDPDLVTYLRSAAKPLQALPLVDDGAFDRYGMTLEELALCCGSHSGSAAHTAVAEAILAKAAMTSDGLECGPHAPFDDDARRALEEAGLAAGRVHNNCSGKHAGMMMLARARGWDSAGYHRPEHPVQQRVLGEVARWTGLPLEAIGLAVDGCGVACFAMPLRQMALAFARFAAAVRTGERGPATVVQAMTEHPEMVAGEGRIDTALMRVAAGRLFAKTGAEGMYCVGVPGAELGIALKVDDGASRAVAPAVLGVLRELDLISEDDLGELHAFAYPDLLNTRGEVVGQASAAIRLRTPDA
ncbi:MAG TPA: asparaginase [Longimicrobium sp.]|nr:asparaginase [Longimicrobium sp.]